MKTIILMATLLVSLSAFAGKDKENTNQVVTGATAQEAYDNAQEFIAWVEAGDFSAAELQNAFVGYINTSACLQSKSERDNDEGAPVIKARMVRDITSAVSFKLAKCTGRRL